MKRTVMVVLAASRKDGGLCYAGKEIKGDSAGGWVRPVSFADAHLDLTRMYTDDQTLPECLDIVELALVRRCVRDHQKENWLLCPMSVVTRVGALPPWRLSEFADAPATLWANGYSSFGGWNDRVPEAMAREGGTSLCLVELDELTIMAQHDCNGSLKTRARFRYRGATYNLAVTDPEVEAEMAECGRDKRFEPKQWRVFGCVSLGVPFVGFCYKLLASIHLIPRGTR